MEAAKSEGFLAISVRILCIVASIAIKKVCIFASDMFTSDCQAVSPSR